MIDKGIYKGLQVALLVALAASFAGCANRGASTAASSSSETAPAAPTAPSQPKIGPGMNANGDVVDSSKVQGGFGQKVKGRGNWDGEITGRPVPSSAFNRLEIGMTMREAVDLIGPPTSQGAYITGKNFIPFYYGGDRHRVELAYKGRGRLVFAGGSPYGGYASGGNLIWIIHNGNDTGYR